MNSPIDKEQDSPLHTTAPSDTGEPAASKMEAHNHSSHGDDPENGDTDGSPHPYEHTPRTNPLKKLSQRFGKGVDFLILIIAVGILVRLVGGFGDSPVPGLSQGMEAPPINIQTIDGEPFSLQDHQGDQVVLAFWATYCPVCSRTLTALDRVYNRELKEAGIKVFAVSLDPEGPEQEWKIRNYWKKRGLTMPLLVDDGSVAARYGISTIPSLVVLDGEHRVTGSHQGSTGQAKINKMVKSP